MGGIVEAGLTLGDVQAARSIVYRTLRPTPLLEHPLLQVETGLRLLVKHENHNPTGSFKVRGGLNLIGNLSADERRGVITATTGNHGQSIALACRKERVPCTIVVPTGNNPEKNAAMRALGADVVEYGRDFDEARGHVEAIQQALALRYVHSANEPLLIAGVATYAAEIFEDLPEPDVILVPIGGGSGAAGCSLGRSWMGRHTEGIGGPAAGADAFARSWHTGTRVADARIATFAEGLATRVTFDLTFGILQQELDDVVTVTEEELEEGVRLAMRATHNLAEGAGAATLAAAVKLRERLADRTVVCVMSGGNLDRASLARVLAAELRS